MDLLSLSIEAQTPSERSIYLVLINMMQEKFATPLGKEMVADACAVEAATMKCLVEPYQYDLNYDGVMGGLNREEDEPSSFQEYLQPAIDALSGRIDMLLREEPLQFCDATEVNIVVDDLYCTLCFAISNGEEETEPFATVTKRILTRMVLEIIEDANARLDESTGE